MVRRDCEALHSIAIAQATDLASQKEAYALANAALARFKRVDVWINLAPPVAAHDESASSALDLDAEIASYEHGATAALACFELLKGGVLINVDATSNSAAISPAARRDAKRRIDEAFARIEDRATAVSGVRVTSVGCSRHTVQGETLARMIVSLARALSKPGALGKVHGAVERERFRLLSHTMPHYARRTRAVPLIGSNAAASNAQPVHEAPAFAASPHDESAPQHRDRESGSWRLATTASKREHVATVTLLLGVPAAIAALLLLAR